MKQIRYSDTLGLSVQQVSSLKTTNNPTVVPTNHIVVIDVSGSMYSDLPHLRKQLKNKLPSLMKEKDTITLVWFSGRDQYGILQEEIEVKSLTDLSKLNEAIDKYLRPVGLTGFRQPLQAVLEVVERIRKNRPNAAFSLFFMSDGYDNQWSRPDILKAAAALKTVIGSASFIEYGWSADRDLLSKMAETCGGTLVFSQSFDDYEIHFGNSLTRGGGVASKKALKLTDEPVLDYAFSWNDDGEIVTYSIEDGEVLLPDNVTTVSYFSKPSSQYKDEIDTETYIGLITLSQRMKANEIFSILGAMGDVYLVNRFTNAFSKQDYIDFQTEVLAEALGLPDDEGVSTKRYRSGLNKNAVPKDDAYTVLDLINDLASDSGNLLYPRDKSFNYKRIGAGSEQRDESVKFAFNEANPGVPLANVVYNSKRPNVSMLVKFDGTVDLSNVADSQNYPSLPKLFPTWIFRNYTVIRDGIVNTRRLPVSITSDTISKLITLGVLDQESAPAPGELFVLDISDLPVINRKMVQSITAAEVFSKVFALEQLKGAQKVFKFYRDKYVEKKSESYTLLYGEEATIWLKSIGLSDNGFAPPSDSVELNDFYVAKELSITVKGLSSLPKVDDVVAKMETGKSLTLGATVMVDAIKKVQAFLDSSIYKRSADPDKLLVAWIESEAKLAVAQTRQLNAELSKTKAIIILGHVWFTDLAPGEDSLTFKAAGQDVTVTAKLEDKEIGNSN